MDPERENELLIHVAAGTDLPTAFAALPSDHPPEARSPGDHAWLGWFAFFVAIAVIWWVFTR